MVFHVFAGNMYVGRLYVEGIYHAFYNRERINKAAQSIRRYKRLSIKRVL